MDGAAASPADERGCGATRGAPDKGEFFLTDADRPKEDGPEPAPVWCATLMGRGSEPVWPRLAGLTRRGTGDGREAVKRPTEGVVPREDRLDAVASGRDEGACESESNCECERDTSDDGGMTLLCSSVRVLAVKLPVIRFRASSTCLRVIGARPGKLLCG